MSSLGGLATFTADVHKRKLYLQPACPTPLRGAFPCPLWLQHLVGGDVSVSRSKGRQLHRPG